MSWQKTRELAREIYALSKQGKFVQDFALKDQMRRAAVSIMSNHYCPVKIFLPTISALSNLRFLVVWLFFDFNFATASRGCSTASQRFFTL